MSITVHKNDLPASLDLGPSVAVDSETLGLRTFRDKLCVVQLSAGDGNAHLVQLDRSSYDCPNLKAVLADPRILKIFHYARFDIAAFRHYLGVEVMPVYCTKIASKLARTYTDRHGLRDLCEEILDMDMSKRQQSSDWGAEKLSEAQRDYAAADVLHLHRLKERLDDMLAREGRTDFARKCFDFLHTRVELDLAGWADDDIFAH